MAAFEVRLHADQIRRLLTARDEPVVRWLARTAVMASSRAKEHCPVDTGRLRGSITHEIRYRAGTPVAVIGTNVEYARFVHDGTGIYGPRHARIFPRTAKVLAWKRWVNAPVPPNKGGWWAYRSVKGSPGRPFLRQGLEDVFRGGSP